MTAPKEHHYTMETLDAAVKRQEIRRRLGIKPAARLDAAALARQKNAWHREEIERKYGKLPAHPKPITEAEGAAKNALHSEAMRRKYGHLGNGPTRK